MFSQFYKSHMSMNFRDSVQPIVNKNYLMLNIWNLLSLNFSVKQRPSFPNDLTGIFIYNYFHSTIFFIFTCKKYLSPNTRQTKVFIISIFYVSTKPSSIYPQQVNNVNKHNIYPNQIWRTFESKVFFFFTDSFILDFLIQLHKHVKRIILGTLFAILTLLDISSQNYCM